MKKHTHKALAALIIGAFFGVPRVYLGTHEAHAPVKQLVQVHSNKKSSPFQPWKKQKSSSSQKTDKTGKTGKKEKEKAEKMIYQWLKTYSEILNLVEKKSFRSVDFARFIQDSLKSAVSQIDAHSAFFAPENYKAVMESTSGEFSGIGVSIISKAPDDDTLVIIDVIQGGPAEKAGIKSGDKIIEVNGDKIKMLTSDEVVSKLKGKVGSKLSIKVLRNKKPIDFVVTCDIIKDQMSLCYFFKNQGIYYLSLKMFTENVAIQIAELLKKANEGKCKGLVLDLRRNPGGILDSGIDMAGLFLEKNSLVVVTKDRSKKVVAEYRTSASPVLKSCIPIFILIDNFTASAAEIVAGSLKYHSQKTCTGDKNNKRPLMVFLLGTSTFGKGSVQEVMPVSNGCALKLTTMLYYLPEDFSIQAAGVQPDFVVKPKTIPSEEMKWINELYGKEVALKHHITIEEVEENGGKIDPEAKKDAEKIVAQSAKAHIAVDDEEGDTGNSGNVGPDSSEKDGSKDQKDAKKSDILDLEKGRLEKNKYKNKDSKDNKEDEEKEKSWDEKQREELAMDVQVQASINMISLLNEAKKANSRLATHREEALSFLKKNYLVDTVVELEKIH